jgi:hypothetical protein
VPERTGVLDGNPMCLARLAERLLRRLLVRCRARQRWSDETALENALACAARSITGPPPYSPEDWVRGCGTLLGASESRKLYSEVSTYGIVRHEGGFGWRWGHRFFVDYLTNLTGAAE